MFYNYYTYDQIANEMIKDRRREAKRNRRWSQALKAARNLAVK